MLNKLIIALLLAPLVALCADDLGFEARYWKALHEGRDTSSMDSVLEGLAFPGRSAEPIEQLRQKALEQLKVVEASVPLAPVVNRGPAGAGRSGADWPTVGGSMTHAGATAEPGPLIGEEAWRHPVGWPWQASPLVESNRVWIASPSLDEAMLCLDRATGQRIWATPNRAIGSRPDSAAPVLADGKVIVPSRGGRMVALDQRTGEPLWTGPGIPWRICNVTAATDGRTVFASVFGNAYEFPFDVTLVGLDLKTGRELWKVPGVGGLTAPIVTAGNRFIIGSMGSPILCGYQMGDSAADPPRLLWRLKTGGVMDESLPAVSGNLGYFLSNDGWLRAVR